MKKIILFFCLIQINVFSQNVELKSITGVWKYQNSYNEDTCLNLTSKNPFNGENQMSKKYKFPKLQESNEVNFASKFYISGKWENAFCNISTFLNLDGLKNLDVIYYNDSTRTFKLHWF